VTRILVTRPGGASARWQVLGVVIEAPVLAIEPRPWVPPDTAPDAIAFTSANGVRCAGEIATPYHDLPAFAVGAATAAAARTGGWRDVRDGGGTVVALFDAVAAAGLSRVLHLAGVDRTTASPPPGVSIEVRDVYRAVAVALSATVLDLLATGAIDLVPLYSPRSAIEFARQVDAAGVARATLTLAAISPAAAAAAGTGWRRVAVATSPDDTALFAAAAAVCDNAA
jgi:uroporphyrinogen-III synthase